MREILREIEGQTFDVVIVGGGINGAGVARDAAMRGLRVLLLEKGDLASGTTAWSTRLIHGGLRYLEHGEVGLVRESLRERERLFRIAPHLVRPLSMLIPLYSKARRGRLTVRAGMLAYDLLSFDKSLARHQMLSRAETLRRAPGLSADGLLGAAVYYDAQVEYPERLVLESALSAREHGATILTYARVERLLSEGGRIEGVEFRDSLAGGELQTARARIVVNAAGPWVDRVLLGADSLQPPRLIGGTKGSHIVVEAFAGAPPRDALYAEAHADARPFFIIPWNGRFLIGTTDTRFDADPDEAAPCEDEIDYLLRETNCLLPSAKLGRESVLYAYSGVRPLAYSGAQTEAAITRRHFIHDHAPAPDGLISIVGGKLTTYRNLSEQTVDLLFRKLNLKSPACTTGTRPLPGAEVEDFASFSADFKKHSPLPAASSARLFRIYGTRTAQILSLVSADSTLGEPFSPSTGAIGAEILFAFQHELAETLVDCLWRRTLVGFSSDDVMQDAEAASLVARRHLGWSARRVARELAACHEYLARFKAKREGKSEP
ncbi:MAG TPA: glycerol-3-phosphate dehydrogenase [Pyrinomonadaceae bacterium]|jgi:glycerol-3-phosphate dehydrogenase